MADQGKRKHFAVIGLGVFGSFLVQHLFQQEVEVLGIDKDEKKVDALKQFLKVPVVGDATDRKQLEDAGLNNKDIDVCVIAIGENVEMSIFVTLLVKELGVKVVIARALNKQHAQILKQLKVTKIIFPESMAAEQLARSLVQPHILDEFALSDEHGIAEVVAPMNFVGQSLRELGIRTKFHVDVIAIRRKLPIVVEETGETDLKEEVKMVPEADEQVLEGDVLIVAGKNEDIEKVRTL